MNETYLHTDAWDRPDTVSFRTVKRDGCKCSAGFQGTWADTPEGRTFGTWALMHAWPCHEHSEELVYRQLGFAWTGAV